MKRSISLLLLLFSISTAAAKIEIKGTVLGADGKPCRVAHIFYGDADAGLENRVSKRCDPDGSFEISIPQSGNYTFYASGVDHEETAIPLYLLDDVKTVTVHIRLKANLHDEQVLEPTIIGDWNKFAFSNASPMTRSADGKSFTFEVTAGADTVAYQVLNGAGGHSINGSMADRFVYDGGGDYRSVIDTKNGSTVVITYEPDKIRAKSKSDVLVKFENNAFLQETYSLKSEYDQTKRELIGLLMGQIKGDKEEAFRKAYSRFYDAVTKAQKSKQKQLASYAAVLLADLYYAEIPFPKSYAKEIFDLLPPASLMWAIAPEAINIVTELKESGDARKYLDEALRTNPSRIVKANILSQRLVSLMKDGKAAEARSVYNDLKSGYSDVKDVRYYLTSYNPDAIILAGKPLPDFDVKELGSENRITRTSMLGKYYLIDFWGTWCGPCIRELPELSRVFEKFNGRKGFTIISLALDPSEEVVTKFRSKRFPMPWRHTVLTGLFKDPVCEQFEVQSVPKPILVGPDGTILATGESLRGNELEKTLERFLGEL